MRLARLLLAFSISAIATIAQSSSAASARAVLAPENEPGEKMEMRGVLLGSDGKPVSGATVFAYHTDASGNYNRTGNGTAGNRQARLRGTMRTGADGRFEIRSIKPGTYPGGGVAAHVHFEVTPAGGKTQYFEVVFRGEPYVTQEMIADSARGSAQRVVMLERGSDGLLRASVELRLR